MAQLQCGSRERGLHGCTSRHVCACDRRRGLEGERRRLVGDARRSRHPTAVGVFTSGRFLTRRGVGDRTRGVALATVAAPCELRSWHATRRRTRYFVIVRFRFITKHTFGRCASSTASQPTGRPSVGFTSGQSADPRTLARPAQNDQLAASLFSVISPSRS